jgi:outer membrane lipoprotein-sorting protein
MRQTVRGEDDVMKMLPEMKPQLLRRARMRFVLPFGILLAFLAFYEAEAAAQTADEVVAKALAARGGVKKLKAIQSQRITGVLYFTPDLYGPFMAEFKRPGKMHNEVTIQNKTVVRIINGKGGGWFVNPLMGKDAAQEMSADEIKDAKNESDFDGPLVDSKEKGVSIEFVGTEKVEGHDAYVLKITHKDGTVSNYTFDGQTYLLTRWSGEDLVNGEKVTRETLYHDYRDVSGVKFPFELVSNTPGSDVKQRIVVEKVEIDPQIDDSHFDKPPVPPASPSADTTPQAGRR